MPSSLRKRQALFAACAVGLWCLYLFGLTRTGMLGPDEPRYAAIGQAMASSGDWVTPRLWGEAWFEKPPLLYWMTATGFRLGFNPDLAPRLPLALLSLTFLLFYFWRLRREFGVKAAGYSTAMLGTSAGWLAFSHVAVTDLPLSATFGASMLLVLDAATSWPALIGAGTFLGAAVLAKGLVPLVLFLPAVYWLRRVPLRLLALLGTMVLVAGPWYVLVILRNGQPFIDDFFWKQHFLRMASPELMHVRPFWFYVPVLLAGFFPWTPVLVGFTRSEGLLKDARARFFLLWLLWGLAFFSAALNKLPGYLLPLFPALAALTGIALASAPRASKLIASALGLSAAVAWLWPMVPPLLPVALKSGLGVAPLHFPAAWLPGMLAAAAAVAFLEWKGKRPLAVGLVALSITMAVVGIVWRSFPELDQKVSSRSFYEENKGTIACIADENRAWRYGLQYYVGRNLPYCNRE